MRSISISCGPDTERSDGDAGGTRAGAGAAAEPPDVTTGAVGGLTGPLGTSGSRMSAPSPRPNAFLGIGYDLLGKLGVTLSALAVNIIENNRLTKTWSLRQAHVSRNNTLKNLAAEEAAQIRRDLSRQRG